MIVQDNFVCAPRLILRVRLRMSRVGDSAQEQAAHRHEDHGPQRRRGAPRNLARGAEIGVNQPRFFERRPGRLQDALYMTRGCSVNQAPFVGLWRTNAADPRPLRAKIEQILAWNPRR